MNAAALARMTEPLRRAGPAFERARIQRALKGRSRYRYVKPQVIGEGAGWKVVSPCCSRRIDPDGGVIDIAWLEPRANGWCLHARDHERGLWLPVLESAQLQDLLEQLCADAQHRFWK